MRSLIIFGALTLSVGASLAQNAGTTLSRSECEALWKDAKIGSGSLGRSEAREIVKDFNSADGDRNGRLSRAEFLSACGKGLVVDDGGTGAGSGSTGSASPDASVGDNPAKGTDAKGDVNPPSADRDANDAFKIHN